MNKEEPVLNEDGTIRSYVLTVAGKDFFCKCGCNCFHKPDKTRPEVFECNSCQIRYGSRKDKS